MKNGLALIPLIFFLLVAKRSLPAGNPVEERFNYVVIGAFSIPKHAIEFTEEARRHHFGAQYSLNPTRRLFYVYVLETGNREDAFEEAKKLRKDTPYFDTWVYSGTLGDEKTNGADINPLTGQGISAVQARDEKEMTVANLPQPTQTAIDDVSDASRKFFFRIFSGDKEIAGDVDVMDTDKEKPRRAASYRGNEAVTVRPVNQSGNMALWCDIFGYRKVQRTIDFRNPQAAEGVTTDNNRATVPFELVRLKKGDFAIMYNVYFYKDAGIMRAESRYEVNSLLDMLQENPKYKIRIHGHTNGNAGGKIISMGDPAGFFSLKDTRQGSGSARKLSEERARVIQRYLISKGIDVTRMEIKAWGGKRPIYGEDSPNAQANVRVEIEILED